MVIWLIGLPGTGKTTIASEIIRQLKDNNNNVVMVDGDHVREIFSMENVDDPYSIIGRRINGERIQKICKWLDSQNVNVVCNIVSIFPDMQLINREIYEQYFQVFIDVPLRTLIKKGDREIYQLAYEGNSKNVVGFDIEFPEPVESDMIFRNRFDPSDIPRIAREILEKSGVDK